MLQEELLHLHVTQSVLPLQDITLNIIQEIYGWPTASLRISSVSDRLA